MSLGLGAEVGVVVLGCGLGLGCGYKAWGCGYKAALRLRSGLRASTCEAFFLLPELLLDVLALLFCVFFYFYSTYRTIR